MRYSEFEREVRNLGYSTVDTGSYLHIATARGNRLIVIDKTKACNVDSTYDRFNTIPPDSDKEKLLTLACELAITPLKCREDEKRYRLRLPFCEGNYSYLNQSGNRFYVADNELFSSVKATFTESEIAELKAEHNLDSFIMEEVKEDE